MITGNVTYNGAPYPYAYVNVFNPAGTLQVVQANGNGAWAMPVNAPGTYQVYGNAGSGYGSITYNRTVVMNTTNYVNIALTYTPPGGKCVLAGTNISTPNGGQKRVEQLSQGDAILGYNLTSGKWAGVVRRAQAKGQ